MAVTVLVVDDAEAVRSLMKRYLEEDGYAVLEAANGAEALIMLRAPGVQVSIIVTDMRMPALDGRQLGASLSRFPVPLPVLYVSGFPRPEGFQGPFLQKPFTHQQLTTAVRKLLASPPS